MALPPFPAKDPLLGADGAVSPAWARWLTALREALGDTSGGLSSAFLVEHTAAGAHGAIHATSATIGTLHATTFTADSFTASGSGLPERTDATDVVFVDGDGNLQKDTLAAADLPSGIPEAKIADDGLLARNAGDETITGAWDFAQLPTLPQQSPNRVLAGPSSGYLTGTPTFRALVDDDVPNVLTLSHILGPSTTVAGNVDVMGDLGVHGGALTANDTLEIISGGDLTLAPRSSLVLAPASGVVRPATPYGADLGTVDRKFRSLWVGEAYYETLITMETLATMGGRLLIGPSTALVEDLAAGATTIYTKHNTLTNGDVVYLESRGRVEFLRVTSDHAEPGAEGHWQYTVEREKQGGSGGHDWYAGDALFNTGKAGSGFIDLYSIRGTKSATEVGPTIVGNVRTASGTSSTDPLLNQFNAWSPRWAVGHLNGLYGQGSGTYGAAFGVEDGRHALYTANEIRFKSDASTTYTLLDSSGLALGDTSGDHVLLDSTSLKFKSGATVSGELNGTTWTLGVDTTNAPRLALSATSLMFYQDVSGADWPMLAVGQDISGAFVELVGGTNTGYTRFGPSSIQLGYAGNEHVLLDGTSLKFKHDTVVMGELNGTTWTLGEVASGKPNVQITPSSLQLRNNTTAILDLNGSTGTITGATVRTAASGARVEMTASPNAVTLYDASAAIGVLDGGGIVLGPASGDYNAYDNKYAYRFSVGGSTDGSVFGMYGAYFAGASKWLGLRNTWDGASDSDSGEAVTFIEAVSTVYPGPTTYTSTIQLHSGAGGHGIAYTAPDGHEFTGSVTMSGTLAVDTDTLYVNATDNRVGVGTNAPRVTLDVAGHVYPHTNSAYTLGSSSYKWDNIHLDLPAASSPTYVVASRDNTTNGDLGYLTGFTGTKTVRDAAGTGTVDLVFICGVLQ